MPTADRLSRLLDELWSLCRCRCVVCTREWRAMKKEVPDGD